MDEEVRGAVRYVSPGLVSGKVTVDGLCVEPMLHHRAVTIIILCRINLIIIT